VTAKVGEEEVYKRGEWGWVHFVNWHRDKGEVGSVFSHVRIVLIVCDSSLRAATRTHA
jgi:hypothetical protein